MIIIIVTLSKVHVHFCNCKLTGSRINTLVSLINNSPLATSFRCKFADLCRADFREFDSETSDSTAALNSNHLHVMQALAYSLSIGDSIA